MNSKYNVKNYYPVKKIWTWTNNLWTPTQGYNARKVIAVAYTLRTYWKQFSLGGICKQE